ncbi:hypothetical protein J2736_006741 [Paenibacillus qinlingensis]|uniref:Uncharacterized protein n=1 Tax=Paenibacillus qinlingensis TaxID=1837343 RepID=A0ABU1P7C4_9BACL|nr:hypothetical protein [Paenibacillus qinlingensis]
METKYRFVIKHKETQKYFADTPDFSTRKLFEAKRFYDELHYNLWLATSPYAVDRDDYEFIQIEQTIQEVTPHE